MVPKAPLRALIPSLLGVGLLAGCVSPFAGYYEPGPASRGPPATAQPEPLLEWSHDPRDDRERLAREGYVLIGSASFIASTFPGDQSYAGLAVTQGRRVGAALVLLEEDSADVLADGCCMTLTASYWAEADRGTGM
ncbi:MAG TPA: hypothetical protein VMU44_01190 [Steroidobacteraceae bacterium]|nr:hypothetical protein [Steroidobacteraceae bacterium]